MQPHSCVLFDTGIFKKKLQVIYLPCLHKYDSEVNNSTPNQIKSLQIDVFVNLGCLYNFTEVYF